MSGDLVAVATVMAFDERNRLFDVWNGGNPEVLLVDADDAQDDISVVGIRCPAPGV